MNRRRELGKAANRTRMTTAVRTIILLTVLLALARFALKAALSRDYLSPVIALSVPRPLTQAWTWQLVTSLFLHSNLLTMVANVLLLLALGTPLAAAWGSMRFAIFYVACGIFGSLVSSLTGLAATYAFPTVAPPLVGGATACILGLAAAFAITYAHDYFAVLYFLELRGRAVAALAALAAVLALGLGVLVSGGGAATALAHAGQLSGLGCGFLIMWLEPLAGRYVAAARAHCAESRKTREAAMRERVDALLEKVSRVGMDHLSRRERSFLRSASRLYRRRTRVRVSR